MSKRKVKTVEESISYRQPMQVREILVCPGHMYDFNIKHIYPICPRCGVSFEYDYQNYCGHCGQRLKWTGYSKAKLRYAGDK